MTIKAFDPSLMPAAAVGDVVNVLHPEGDYRKIVFRFDTGETVERWFPLTHEHFHHATCPKLGQRMLWAQVQALTEPV